MNSFRHFAAPAAVLCIGVAVAGCASEPRAEQVPPNARLLVEGDQMLNYSAPQDGEVYVYDTNSNTLIYSGKVQKGQAISIDPEEDKVMIDNKLAVEKDIHAGNRHRIYFVPERDGMRDGMDDRDDRGRVIERERTTVRERTGAARVDPDSTTVTREETRRIDGQQDGDITIKKETTIKAE